MKYGIIIISAITIAFLILCNIVFSQSYDPTGATIEIGWCGTEKCTKPDCNGSTNTFAPNANVYTNLHGEQKFDQNLTKFHRKYRKNENGKLILAPAPFQPEIKIPQEPIVSYVKTERETLSNEMYDGLWNEISDWQMTRIWKATDSNCQIWQYDTRKYGDDYGDHWYQLTKESRAAWYEYFHPKLDLNYMETACRKGRYAYEQNHPYVPDTPTQPYEPPDHPVHVIIDH